MQSSLSGGGGIRLMRRGYLQLDLSWPLVSFEMLLAVMYVIADVVCVILVLLIVPAVRFSYHLPN